MRRAMATSQIFTYLMGIIIISMTILIGYNVINKVADITTKVNDLELDMGSDVQDVANEFGTVSKVRYGLPGKIKFVCIAHWDFLQLNETGWTDFLASAQSGLDATGIPSKASSSIMENLEDAVKANVFIVTDRLEGEFYLENLEVGSIDDTGATIVRSDIPVSCFRSLNGISVVLQGRGDRTRMLSACELDGDCMGGTCVEKMCKL